MSLNWDLNNVANQEDLRSETEWTITQAIIWGTVAVGINTITEANAEEFTTRMRAHAMIYGAPITQLRHGKSVDRFVTLADVRRRIGLRTNASLISAAKFRNSVARTVLDNAASAARKE